MLNGVVFFTLRVMKSISTVPDGIVDAHRARTLVAGAAGAAWRFRHWRSIHRGRVDRSSILPVDLAASGAQTDFTSEPKSSAARVEVVDHQVEAWRHVFAAIIRRGPADAGAFDAQRTLARGEQAHGLEHEAFLVADREDEVALEREAGERAGFVAGEREGFSTRRAPASSAMRRELCVGDGGRGDDERIALSGDALRRRRTPGPCRPCRSTLAAAFRC